MYNACNPFVFFHIPKTAGSSLRESLFNTFRPNQSTTFYPCHNLPCSATINSVSHISHYFGHVTRSMLLDRMSSEKGYKVSSLDSMTCTTTLRHPIERMISHYYFFIFPQEKLPFQTYLAKHGAQHVFNTVGANIQMKYLGPDMKTAINTLNTCVIGITEKMEEYQRRLSSIFKFKFNIAHRNERKHHRTTQDELTVTQHQEFESLFRNDMILWQHAEDIVNGRSHV